MSPGRTVSVEVPSNRRLLASPGGRRPLAALLAQDLQLNQAWPSTQLVREVGFEPTHSLRTQRSDFTVCPHARCFGAPSRN